MEYSEDKAERIRNAEQDTGGSTDRIVQLLEPRDTTGESRRSDERRQQ